MMTNRKLRTSVLLGAGILIISGHLPITISQAAARSLSTYFVPTDVDTASSKLLAAAEPFEALAEIAYSALGLHLERAIADAATAATAARSSLPEASVALLDVRVAEIYQAHKADDRAGLALASVEAYRILVSAARPGKVPTAVNLMDYAGFRYDADFRAMPTRWSDMKAAAAYAREQWDSISSQIADPILKQSVEAAISDMELGADQQNTFKARRSVNAELGLVDQLEEYFSKP
jgi:hypothetical protein